MNKSEKTVTTINNEVIPISKGRKFEAGWYKIGNIAEEESGDCYDIDGRYYRIETGAVVFNYLTKRYVLKNDNLIHGIISLNDDGYNLGYFDISDKNIITNTPNGKYRALNELIFKDSKIYRERISNGEYYHIDILDAKAFNQMKVPSNEYKTSLPYDSGGVLSNYIDKYDKLNIDLSQNVMMYSSILKNFSFGLEFETTAGVVPERILNETGLIPLRDGSISGIEYVTVPMQGAKGLQTIINAAKELSKRTTYNDSCALHQHIGNIPRTKEFILAFFKLTCAIQDEIYTMFPLYKKYNFRLKNKNYSKPYPIFELISQMDCCINNNNINENFNILYQYLSMGENFKNVGNDLKNVTSHPADRESRAKWNISTRYYLNNFIPIIFGNKQTIEFRVHTPTFDVNKIVAFLILNVMMIDFTIQNTDKILMNKEFLAHIDLKTIVSEMIKRSDIKNPSRLSSFMFNYIDTRKQYTESQNREGKIKGSEKSIPVPLHINWNQLPIKESEKPENFDEFDAIIAKITKEHDEALSFDINQLRGMRRDNLIQNDETLNAHITSKRKKWEEAKEVRIAQEIGRNQINTQEQW